MNTLYYVTGYDWDNNEWWRFVITAPSADDAAIAAKTANQRLTRLSATAVCQTPDDVYAEL